MFIMGIPLLEGWHLDIETPQSPSSHMALTHWPLEDDVVILTLLMLEKEYSRLWGSVT